MCKKTFNLKLYKLKMKFYFVMKIKCEATQIYAKLERYIYT